MAVLFYKWFLLILLQTGLAKEKPHPFHVSVTEINHNEAEKTLEISCKIFTDDFEDVLTSKYKTKVDLVKSADKPAMDKLVKDYIDNHLAIKADNKDVRMNYIGFEVESEAAYVYLQVNNLVTIKNAQITNTVLHDRFTDQTEIIHFIEKGIRKSVKIDYPVSVASFQF